MQSIVGTYPNTDQSLISRLLRTMESSPLRVLPQELIFQVLEFMEPHEYSGFSCTCQRALSLVNRKLDTPENRRLDLREFNRSCTAAFVARHRAWIEQLLRENGTTSGCCSSAEIEANLIEDDLYL
jgi:hypothetical protein